jgi:hypothetical protein
MLPEAMSWTEIQSGSMDPDPVLLVAEILAVYTVIWVYVYWTRLCHNVVRMERDGLWAARSALAEIDELCRRRPDRLPADRLASAVRRVIGRQRTAEAVEFEGRRPRLRAGRNPRGRQSSS